MNTKVKLRNGPSVLFWCYVLSGHRRSIVSATVPLGTHVFNPCCFTQELMNSFCFVPPFSFVGVPLRSDGRDAYFNWKLFSSKPRLIVIYSKQITRLVFVRLYTSGHKLIVVPITLIVFYWAVLTGVLGLRRDSRLVPHAIIVVDICK